MKRNPDYQKQTGLPYPTQAVLILSGGLILVKASPNGNQRQRGGKRRKIMALSRRSLDRLGLVALSTATLYFSILTLSYGVGFPRSGKRVKQDIKRVLQWLQKRGCKDYLWFVEFQDRGAPHVHFLLDMAQIEIDKFHNQLAFFWSFVASIDNWEYSSIRWDKKKKKLVQYGRKSLFTREAVYSVNSHPSQWEILRSTDGGARYALKYAMKKEQKMVPSEFSDIGRFWATPQHLSLKNLVKTWTYTDDDGVIAMCEKMGRNFSNWDYLPKMILGNTDEICKILIPDV